MGTLDEDIKKLKEQLAQKGGEQTQPTDSSQAEGQESQTEKKDEENKQAAEAGQESSAQEQSKQADESEEKPKEGEQTEENKQPKGEKLLSKGETIAELKQKLEEYESKATMLEEYLKKVADPLSLLSSEKVVKVAQLIEKHKDIPKDIAYEIVDNIDGIDPIKALAYDVMIKEPNIEGGLEGAMELVLEKYEVEDVNDIPRTVKNKIMLDAKAAKQKLSEMVSELPSIERPEPIDEVLKKIEPQLTSTKEVEEAWLKSYDNIKSKAQEIRITPTDGGEPFVYKIEDNYFEETKELLPRVMLSYGKKPDSEDAIEAAKQELQLSYVAENFNKIAEAYATYRVSKAVEEIKKEQAGMKVERPSVGAPEKVDGNPSVEEILSRSKKYF